LLRGETLHQLSFAVEIPLFIRFHTSQVVGISSINSRSPIFFFFSCEVTSSSLVKELPMAQKNTLDFPIASPKMKGLMCIYPLERMADRGCGWDFLPKN